MESTQNQSLNVPVHITITTILLACKWIKDISVNLTLITISKPPNTKPMPEELAILLKMPVQIRAGYQCFNIAWSLTKGHLLVDVKGAGNFQWWLLQGKSIFQHHSWLPTGVKFGRNYPAPGWDPFRSGMGHRIQAEHMAIVSVQGTRLLWNHPRVFHKQIMIYNQPTQHNQHQ
jgi:hypothetical protein